MAYYSTISRSSLEIIFINGLYIWNTYSLMAYIFGIAICVRWGLGGVELRREKIGIDLLFMAYTIRIYICMCVRGGVWDGTQKRKK